MAQTAFALQFVHEIRKKDPGMGGKKLWYMYQTKLGKTDTLGRYRFEDMINEYDLKVRQRRRHPRTTDSTHGYPTYPNLIKEFFPYAPNMLWVSDITYIEIYRPDGSYKFCYLSLILDAYTEEIVGYCVGETLEAVYCIKALKMALKRINGLECLLIHHSDRGVQYVSADYVKILKQHNIRISMTETGDPKDNAQAERINNTMKNELLKGKRFYSIKEVRQAVNEAVVFYNTERPHMSFNMMTPENAALCYGEIVKRWKSYRLQAIKNNLNKNMEDFVENSLLSPKEGDSLRATPFIHPLPA